MKSYLAKLRMKQWSHAQPMTERTRKTHSQSPWFKNTQITQTGRDSKQHLGLVHFPTVPGARGGNASVDPAPPAAASSSPSSSRFSSSPGARIFLTRTRFKDLEPDTKEMTHSSNSDAWKSLHQYLFIYLYIQTHLLLELILGLKCEILSVKKCKYDLFWMKQTIFKWSSVFACK